MKSEKTSIVHVNNRLTIHHHPHHIWKEKKSKCWWGCQNARSNSHRPGSAVEWMNKSSPLFMQLAIDLRGAHINCGRATSRWVLAVAIILDRLTYLEERCQEIKVSWCIYLIHLIIGSQTACFCGRSGEPTQRHEYQWMQRRVCRLTKVREAGCIVESGEARIKFDIQRLTYPWVDTSWGVSCSCLGDHTNRSAWVDARIFCWLTVRVCKLTPIGVNMSTRVWGGGWTDEGNGLRPGLAGRRPRIEPFTDLNHRL